MLKKWLDIRYSTLESKFSANEFRFKEAAKLLKEKYKDAKDQINVILSELKKAGFLSVRLDPLDSRKRIYQLKSREDIITQILTPSPAPLTRSELESLLKKAADLIRTRVDYTFILILLFYKRISDKWETEYEESYKEALEDGLSEHEAKKEAKVYGHDFKIPQKYLWQELRKEPARLPENFSAAMKAIAEQNPELKEAFENVDFIQFTTNRENAEILRQLVELFSVTSLYHVSPDILGDAYEWILRYFAPQKAKEGEVYTAREVIKLIIELLDPKAGQSVYDPACGSGGMLISAYQHVKDIAGKQDADKLFLFGQEANHKTLSLAKMNVYIHDIRNAKLALGDTLLSPKFKKRESFQKFDFVIANPPWNQDGYDEPILKKGEYFSDRFNFGFTPKQSADWAWIQHMLASAKKTGKVGVVIDNGCLFRSGKEKIIRKQVIDKDLLESVILLPEKLFYNTGAPGAILIFNKNKPAKHKGKILFINASQEYEQHPEVRKLNKLSDKNIKKITDAYKEFTENDGFFRAVGKDEIEENDYNLNVTLYVFPEEKIEEIDVDFEWVSLKQIDSELSDIDKKIEGYLKEIK